MTSQRFHPQLWAIAGLHVDYNIHVLHIIIFWHHLEIQVLHITMEVLRVHLQFGA
jgi:hypothetical protein